MTTKISYIFSLAQRQRTRQSNRHLAYILTLVAGAVNAGGYFAVEQYTSHMTGIVSSMADHVAVFKFEMALSGLAALLAFISGAACSSLLVGWGMRTDKQGAYALPLMLEAFLLICFGLMDHHLGQYEWLFLPMTVLLLSFVMGLQNALITDISNAEIRTTHVTGMVTDIGMELGRLAQRSIHWRHPERLEGLPGPNTAKLALLVVLVTLFFCGGVIGALGFKYIGCIFTVIVAAVLVKLAFVPVVDDLMMRQESSPPNDSLN